jgi:hypothetical protein
MGAPPNPTLEEFSEFVENIPPRLGLWRTASKAELWPLLAWLNVWSVQEMRETSREIGAMMAAKLRHAELHNTVGVGVSWLLRFLQDNPSAPGSEDMERNGFARRAGQVWSIRDLVHSARAGAYEFQAQGHRLHFEFAGDTDLEALDNMLEMVDELWRIEQLRDALSQDAATEKTPLQELLLTSGIHIPWQEASQDIQHRFRRRAAILTELLRRIQVPHNAVIGNFTFGDAVAIWTELLAGASYSHACLMFGSQNPLVACPAVPLQELVEVLRPSNLDDECISTVINFLTFDVTQDRDPCLAPIIPVHDSLAPLSSLITPGSPDRNVLARLRSDPARFGGIGREIGRVGTETVANELTRVDGVHVAKEVKVLHLGGGVAGDLDVVAVDPRERLVAVFEVKWQLEPDGALEIDRVEKQASEGQTQLLRLMTGLRDESLRPRWPGDFPNISSFDWQWFVITSNVIPVIRSSGHAIARSHRVLTLMALREGSTLREVCNVLADPPIPPTAREEYLETGSQQFWGYEITVRRPR